MWKDPIVEELRRFRDEHAARFNYDLDAIVKDLQESERTSGRQVVSFAPKMYRRSLGQEEGEPVTTAESDQSDSSRLMAFAGTIDWPMEDPVDWQRQRRSEWDRPWDR